MSRDYKLFGLRMPPELKARIEKEAKLNGRSLNMEIMDRLQRSLVQQDDVKISGYKVSEPSAAKNDAMSDLERQLLAVLRRLPLEKQLALVTLLQ